MTCLQQKIQISSLESRKTPDTDKESPTYGMTEYTLDSKCETLGKLLRSLDGSLVRLVEEILNAGSQTTDDTERIAEHVETKHEHIHLLQALTFIIHHLSFVSVNSNLTTCNDNTEQSVHSVNVCNDKNKMICLKSTYIGLLRLGSYDRMALYKSDY